MKLAVLERNSVGTDVDVSCFEKFGEVTYYPNTVADNAAERVKDADIVIANKAPMNEETLKDAPNVKLICLFATGFDNVDLAYCKKRGIRVANVVNYCTPAVAQHTLLLAMMLAEKIAFYDDYVKSGAYSAQDRFSNFDRTFHDLAGKTWGIVGMGSIGHRVAELAEAFGCKVIFYSASGKSTCTDYERVEFETLLRESDILSLHCQRPGRQYAGLVSGSYGREDRGSRTGCFGKGTDGTIQSACADKRQHQADHYTAYVVGKRRIKNLPGRRGCKKY